MNTDALVAVIFLLTGMVTIVAIAAMLTHHWPEDDV